MKQSINILFVKAFKKCLCLHVYETVLGKKNNLFRQTRFLALRRNWKMSQIDFLISIKSHANLFRIFTMFLVYLWLEIDPEKKLCRQIKIKLTKSQSLFAQMNCNLVHLSQQIWLVNIKSIKSTKLLIKLTNLIR